MKKRFCNLDLPVGLWFRLQSCRVIAPAKRQFPVKKTPVRMLHESGNEKARHDTGFIGTNHFLKKDGPGGI